MWTTTVVVFAKEEVTKTVSGCDGVVQVVACSCIAISSPSSTGGPATHL